MTVVAKKPRRPTVPFVQAIVARSIPNPDRPRLPADFEHQLEPIERRTAACYAGSEALARRTTELSAELGAVIDDLDVEMEIAHAAGPRGGTESSR